MRNPARSGSRDVFLYSHPGLSTLSTGFSVTEPFPMSPVQLNVAAPFVTSMVTVSDRALKSRQIRVNSEDGMSI